MVARPVFFDKDHKLKAVIPKGDRLSIFMALFLAKTEFDTRQMGTTSTRVDDQKKLSRLRHDKKLLAAKTMEWMESFNIPNDSTSYVPSDIQPIIDMLTNYRFIIYTRVPPILTYSIQWMWNADAVKFINIVYLNGNFDIFEPTRETIGTICPITLKMYCPKELFALYIRNGPMNSRPLFKESGKRAPPACGDA